MGFWTKVIGGAVVGVGAIAAAPFTGGGSLLGAATLASSLAGAGAIAAGAGAVGAAAGAVMDSMEKDEENKKLKTAKLQGEQEASARNAIEMDKLRDELADILRDIEVRENFLLTAFAVGICAANADHEICDDERTELEELVAGLGKADVLSSATQARLEAWYNNPPNLNTVWQMIENNNLNQPRHIAVFDKIVKMVIWADEEQNAHESEFIDCWNSLVA
ncbi:TPA: hypothetical protein ACN3X6_001650 [Vibrio cholerae]|uniref:hypothetical protein n=1 Tax=Vibrio parahaemolyticus TaxID=670 RepID=UPI00084B0146|nr:hypothetical protein [Vibrio parahaemolyticus]EIU6807748.1 hypothetical protein [Vibrio parahaemolyticus]OEB49514.1 hypothetical protein BBN06_08135 [Vibrio parahaemolyticus]WMN85468.1 hypothetical protein NI384_16545 [Vibrio parahaemolyticus]HBC3376483.1 hypothetical protein [Vibrio cholerae]